MNIGEKYAYIHVKIEKYPDTSNWLSLEGRVLFSFVFYILKFIYVIDILFL